MPADVQQLIRRNRIPTERAGNVKLKTGRLCAVRAGYADPFTALGTHHSPDSCNFALVPFLTAQLKKFLESRVAAAVGGDRRQVGQGKDESFVPSTMWPGRRLNMLPHTRTTLRPIARRRPL
jgi:hypothetical protein